MALTHKQADRICALLKERNRLSREYSPAEILAGDYRCRFVGDEVIAFVELKKVQWYQSEVRHLTVALGYEKRGHAKALIQEMEEAARQQRSRVLQCTIREDNVDSLGLFEHLGFRVVNKFFNQVSNNSVNVLQKVLVSAR
jgi:ribosomal protein S18 acetylase RimI-like enzyme